jgi:hypothetical protein
MRVEVGKVSFQLYRRVETPRKIVNRTLAANRRFFACFWCFLAIGTGQLPSMAIRRHILAGKWPFFAQKANPRNRVGVQYH